MELPLIIPRRHPLDASPKNDSFPDFFQHGSGRTLTHVLSPEEEDEYIKAAKQESVDLHDVAAIMLQQGPRPDEVMSLQQAHVDLFNRHFTIWDNSAQGKSRNAHRRLKMTDKTFHVFTRRLSEPGIWVFPSPKNDGPRTTVQKSHMRAIRDRPNKEGRIRVAAGLSAAFTT